jgi:hypothetical protein
MAASARPARQTRLEAEKRFTTRFAGENGEAKEKKMLRHFYAASTPHKNAATPFMEESAEPVLMVRTTR